LRTRVFISYSRKDQEFVERLAASLDERGFVPDWDQTTADPDSVSAGISAEDQWWARLQELIAAADVMVFVVSPDSATSKVCDEEIAYARALGKRVIPILRRTIDFKQAPPRLAALNVKISFITETASYDDSLERLARALALDVGWMRELTRLSQAATAWSASGSEKDRLLRGDEVRAAENWAARRPASAPPVSALMLEFLEASRDFEEERRAISEVERLRYQEIDRVTREFLEEELKHRESRPRPGHPGVDDELATEKELVRSLVGLQIRWHPQAAQHIASTGARDGYAEIFGFPCCDLKIKDFLATSERDPPSQFRADGCEEIPESIRYEASKPTNPFRSLLIAHYRQLTAATD
jgi:nucleoside 2-deoxyribosyltransferase